MVRGPQDETSDQPVNPAAILQAMQTAVAQGLKATYKAPQELPPDSTPFLRSC